MGEDLQIGKNIYIFNLLNLKYHNMRPLKLICLFVTAFVFVYSCKKESNNQSKNDPSLSFIVKSADQWIKTQKNQSSIGDRNEIDSLIKKMDWSNSFIVKINLLQNLLVVPQNSQNNNKVLDVVIFLCNKESNTIVYSYQWKFSPSSFDKFNYRLSDIYEGLTNGDKSSYAGSISILSIKNKFIEEIKYSDSKIQQLKILKTKNKSTGKANENKIHEKITGCIDWYWEYYIDGVLVYEEYAFTTCSDTDECQSTKLSSSTKNIFYFKINCGGGGSGNDNAGPGDRLCAGTFAYQNSPNNSNFVLNVMGLQFEDGYNVNPLPGTVFALTNSISDAALNNVPSNDYLGQNETPLQYLNDFFHDLFTSGDIHSTYQNNQKIWVFSTAAATRISSFVSNLAAMGTMAAIPNAAVPYNSAAWNEFYTQSTNLINCFMPGSTIRQGNVPTAPSSYAVYSPNC